MPKDNNVSIELNYIVHPFPQQKQYIFRIYNAEDLEQLYTDNHCRHSLIVEDYNVYLNIGKDTFLLKNIDHQLIDDFLAKKITWGFSFLDSFHSVISGFYASHPDKYKLNKN